MGDVVDIEEHRPHLVISLLDENVVVCPIALMEKIVSGDMRVTEIDEWELLVRTIISEWLGFVDSHISGGNDG